MAAPRRSPRRIAVAVAGDVGEALGEEVAGGVVEATGSGGGLVGEVEHDVEQHLVDVVETDLVLGGEFVDSAQRGRATVFGADLPVDGEAADAPDELGAKPVSDEMGAADAGDADTVGERGAADVAHQLLDPEVRGERHHCVRAWHRLPVRVGEVPRVEQREERVEEVRVRLLDLVEQQDGAGPAQRVEQRGRVGMPDVPRRDPEHPGQMDLLAQLAAVDPVDVRLAVAEVAQRPWQRLDGGRLPHAGRADQQHRAGPGGAPLRELCGDHGRDTVEGGVLPVDV